MHLPDQAVGEWKAFAQAAQPMVEGGHIVGHLDDVVEGHAGRLLQLEQQQVGKRGLRPFDLGGEDGLLADIGVQEGLGVGEQCRKSVEPADRQERLLQVVLQRGEVEGR